MRAAIALLGAILMAGCATSGNKVSEAQSGQIVIGKTMQAELLSLLGPPTIEAYNSDVGRALRGAAVIGADGIVKSWSRSGNTASSGADSYVPTTATSAPARTYWPPALVDSNLLLFAATM